MDELDRGISVSIDAELARFTETMQAAGRVVETSTGEMDRATKRAERSFAQLEARQDPAARALQRYERSVEIARRALDKKAVSQERVARSLEASRRYYDETIRKLNEVEDANNRAGGAASRNADAVMVLRRAFVALGGAMVIREAIKMGDAWSDMSSRVGAALGDMDRAPAVMSRLVEVAQRTYSSIDVTTESFVQNSSALRALGYTTQQQLDYTEALNNAFVISGAKGERAAAVQNALSKAMAEGVLRGENLNTVIQMGGRVAEALADSMGVSVLSLRDLGREGRITRTDLFGITSELEKLREEADAMPATVADAQMRLRTELTKTIGEIMNSSEASAELVGALEELRKVVISDEFREGLGFLALTLADIGRGAADSFVWIGDLAEGLRDLDIAKLGDVLWRASSFGIVANSLRDPLPEAIAKGASDPVVTAFDRGVPDYLKSLSDLQIGLDQYTRGAVAATSATEGLTKEQERAAEAQERREVAGRKQLTSIEQEIELLEKRLAGREAEIPFMEAENRLRETLARDLLPEEQRELKRLIDERERLKQAIERQTEAERKAAEEAKRAAQEVQRIWDRAGENIQDALADAFVRGKADMASFRDFALNTAAQIVAAMVFRPVIQPIIASAQGGLSMGGPGAVTVGGVPIGGGGGLMGGLSSILNGGLSSSWLTGLGREFATSSIGSALGLSNVGVKGATIISGSGASFAQAFGNLPYAGIGGMLGGLMGLGSGNALIDMGLSSLGGIAGSMLATSAVGSSIGSALGIGSAALGPIGAVVGGILGTALGGLFEQKPSNKAAIRRVDLGEGTADAVWWNPGERSQATIDATEQMAQAFLQATQAITALTGGSGPLGAYIAAGERDGFQAYVGAADAKFGTAGMRSFRDAEKAVEWMIGEFTRQITGVTDENIRKAIAYGGDTETLLGNLTFVQQLNALTDDGSMALVNALKALNDQFDEMAQQAKKLGIATSDLERVREREIAATRAQFEAVITGLQGQANSAAQQYFAQTLDPLTQFRDSVLRQGQLSNMSARDQFLYSQSLFRGIDETTSASDIVSLGQTYLTQARNFGASGDVFTAAFKEVNSVIGRLIDTREEEKRGFEALGVTFQTSIGDQTAELKGAIEKLMDEVIKLRRAQEKAA